MPFHNKKNIFNLNLKDFAKVYRRDRSSFWDKQATPVMKTDIIQEWKGKV